MANEIALWVREFGAKYQIPREVTAEPGLIDVSWHNDICPSFAWNDRPTSEDDDVRLWVEHVDPAFRENDVQRFTIIVNSDVHFETDDVLEALAKFRAVRDGGES